MPRFDTLSEQDLEAISRRQSAQQRAWRELPPEGGLVECCGQAFLVLPNVFPPRRDTHLFVDTMTLEPGAAVLDMGTGSGVLAVFAALKGARPVVAVDLNPEAVRNAAINADRFGLRDGVETRVSDGFSAIREAERFDVILANLPGRSQAAADLVEAAQWDTAFGLHRGFFAQAPAHLRPGGTILMTKANYPELNTVVELAEGAGFEVRALAKREPQEGDPRTYYALAFSL